MKIYHSTLVRCEFESAILKFDQILFEKLSPPLINLKVNRFDGCKKHDEIHLEMNFLGHVTRWVSVITADAHLENEFYFIDEGKDLPAPLKYWKHTHIVKKISKDQSMIIDEIEYFANNSFLTKIIYPALYTMFYLRKPIYIRELKNE